MEVIVQLRSECADRQGATLHHGEARHRGRELQHRAVRHPGHRVVAGPGSLAQQHRDHRHRVGGVRVDQIRAIAQQTLLLGLDPDVEPGDVLQPDDRDAVVIAGPRELGDLGDPFTIEDSAGALGPGLDGMFRQSRIVGDEARVQSTDSRDAAQHLGPGGR